MVPEGQIPQKVAGRAVGQLESIRIRPVVNVCHTCLNIFGGSVDQFGEPVYVCGFYLEAHYYFAPWLSC